MTIFCLKITRPVWYPPYNRANIRTEFILVHHKNETPVKEVPCSSPGWGNILLFHSLSLHTLQKAKSAKKQSALWKLACWIIFEACSRIIYWQKQNTKTIPGMTSSKICSSFVTKSKFLGWKHMLICLCVYVWRYAATNVSGTLCSLLLPSFPLHQ